MLGLITNQYLHIVKPLLKIMHTNWPNHRLRVKHVYVVTFGIAHFGCSALLFNLYDRIDGMNQSEQSKMSVYWVSRLYQNRWVQYSDEWINPDDNKITQWSHLRFTQLKGSYHVKIILVLLLYIMINVSISLFKYICIFVLCVVYTITMCDICSHLSVGSDLFILSPAIYFIVTNPTIRGRFRIINNLIVISKMPKVLPYIWIHDW